MIRKFMRIKDRVAAVVLSAAMAAGLAGCGAAASAEGAGGLSGDGRLNIVCTGFSEYDWTKNIVGDCGAEVTYLLDNGVDMHSYQPTAADIVKIAQCDLFIYVGGESQGWADDALKEKTNENQRSVKLLDVLSESGAVKEEEIKEGMQGEAEEEEAEAEEAPEYDEHVWLTPGNAEIFCGRICEELKAADPENAAEYEKNLEAYNAELKALAEDFSAELAECPNKTLIVADRFPFRYLADEYGLDYYAAFAGCSAETEASFETVAFLSGKVDEVKAGTVFTLENSDGKIAQAVIGNTAEKNAKVSKLNSLQSVTAEQIKGGATYTGLMRDNLTALKEALK